ncbi:hypothetical protein CCAN11_1950011 [Capnocytophaga canimorsus]|uniref:Uncharacterized protein n=1 Tax=Capnocytophaga canimorsus TaxID=28188 RepID=A0A0B7IC47_9FLAO|nr:hypothetical protein CCAN11_1950011 [Capnocytophaga canimorsus]
MIIILINCYLWSPYLITNRLIFDKVKIKFIEKRYVSINLKVRRIEIL